MASDATFRSVPDLLAIGNAIVDVIAREDDGFLERHGLVKGSMALVDAERAELLYGDMGPAVETSGGSAANTAVGFAALGGSAAFVGKVRDDQLGHVYLHDLRAAGVAFDVPPAPPEDLDPTGRSLIVVTPDAQRTMNTNLGIAARVEVADVDADLVAASTSVYAEGYLWDSDVARAAIERAFDLARAAGRRVAFTLSDGFCVDRHRATFRALLAERVDIAFANEDEVLSLTGAPSFDAAVDDLADLVPLAFVTRSAAGAVVAAGGDRHVVPAHPVDEVVDTTGAGDLFAAGALYGLSRGADLVTCARLGALAAAEVIGHIGPRPEADLRALADAAGLP
jgi:sugar/nucleoside kinase (ribokinase family)